MLGRSRLQLYQLGWSLWIISVEREILLNLSTVFFLFFFFSLAHSSPGVQFVGPECTSGFSRYSGLQTQEENKSDLDREQRLLKAMKWLAASQRACMFRDYNTALSWQAAECLGCASSTGKKCISKFDKPKNK